MGSHNYVQHFTLVNCGDGVGADGALYTLALPPDGHVSMPGPCLGRSGPIAPIPWVLALAKPKDQLIYQRDLLVRELAACKTH